MAMRYLDVHEFDMTRIKPGSFILVLGDRGTGKTCMSVELLYHLRKYPMGVVMAGSLDTVDEYKSHVPQTLIYDEYNPDCIKRILLCQDKKLRRYGYARLKPLILVLDDLMYDKTKINNDQYFRKLVLNSRHYKTTIIVCCQYVKHMSAELRPNLDYIFTTYQKNPEQRKKIRQEFGVGFPNDKVFHETMVRCTSNWACLVLDKRSVGRDGLHDSVFHRKAVLNRKFRVGSYRLWNLHRNRYNPYHGLVGLEEEEADLFEDNKHSTKVVIRKIRPRVSLGWL